MKQGCINLGRQMAPNRIFASSACNLSGVPRTLRWRLGFCKKNFAHLIHNIKTVVIIASEDCSVTCHVKRRWGLAVYLYLCLTSALDASG